MDLFDPHLFHNLINEAASADITSWCLKVAIVWRFMGKKVKSSLDDMRADFTAHFAKVEQGFADLVKEVQELKLSVKEDLKKGDERFKLIESDISQTKNRVERLENEKGLPK